MSEASMDSKVIQTYRARHPKSAALYERARAVIPGGIRRRSCRALWWP